MRRPGHLTLVDADAYSALVSRCTEQRERAEKAEARIEAPEKDYRELIYAVATKCEGETRHQTALRYIVERELRGMGDGRPALAAEEKP